MSWEDHLKGIQSHSSSVQSTPERNGHPDYTVKGSEVLQGYQNSGPKRKLLRSCIDYKKINYPPKSRMIEQLKACNKNVRYPEKQSRKSENPVCFTPTNSSDFGCSTTCKNSACKAALSVNDAFCQRCSCCICHRFDDNKDPSLWLVCGSESQPGDSCGLSCHVECAFKREKLGVVNLGQYMQLDGSYSCASCGKVSGILGFWRKQLAIAKDAQNIDVLCYRVFLSYRLLNGSSRFKELHGIITEAKTMLEAEVGPMNGESVKMDRGVVSRLGIASDTQKLCCNAIDKAEEWLAMVLDTTPNCTVDSVPAACRLLFEEVTSSSLVIVLIDIPAPLIDSIKGYKLWYSNTNEETSKYPPSIFPRDKRRISVKNLQPCTEYTFRVMSYTETSELGHSEAKCSTRSAGIINVNPPLAICEENHADDLAGSSSGYKGQNLGKILHLAWVQEQGRLEGFCSAGKEQCCGVIKCESPKRRKSTPFVRELDLNVVSVPDLNEDLSPPLEPSRDEDNVCPLEQGGWPDYVSASHGIVKNGPSWLTRKRRSSAIEAIHDCDSNLVNGSPFRVSNRFGSLDGNFEYCVKVIRWLECQGYIKQEFRLKLLTWFCLRSTEQERRVVNTFIQTLVDDPKSLAGQLVDSFANIISCK